MAKDEKSPPPDRSYIARLEQAIQKQLNEQRKLESQAASLEAQAVAARALKRIAEAKAKEAQASSLRNQIAQIQRDINLNEHLIQQASKKNGW